MSSPSVSPIPLRLGVFCLLLGQCLLYAQSLSPLSVLVWNEDWLAGLVGWLTGLSWSQWAENSAGLIVTLNRLGAALLFAGAVAALFPGSLVRRATPFLLASSLLLMLHAGLVFDDTSWNSGEAVERALFALSPLVLAAVLRGGENTAPAWPWVLLISTAMTFGGHGLFALGWWAVPGEWMFMTQSLLHTSDAGSLLFLKIAGAIDLVAAAALFVPGRVRLAGLAYCCFWGLATALARSISHYEPAENWHGLNPWLWESLWRMIHFLAPLALLLGEAARRKKQPVSAGLAPQRA